ncbi:MAG: hemerythrin domain-containing protein [Burkholderiales bacterium]|nr:hemerythrin domain-containing protein [Burkholderiales bacterium]
MDPIATLMSEHRAIERVLDALVAFADAVERSGATDKQELSRFVTFLREFADAGHHGKEEDILFQAMAEGGFPAEDGPIGVMLREHDEGRAFVGILDERARQDTAWSEADRRQIGATAHGFADLMRSHIEKEDDILYPMARHHLGHEAFEGVVEACTRFEALRERNGIADRMQALGEELAGRYGRA